MYSRIKVHLDKLINRDQTGFIKGRFIGENIRLIYDIIQYTDHKQIPGLLMLIDLKRLLTQFLGNLLIKH